MSERIEAERKKKKKQRKPSLSYNPKNTTHTHFMITATVAANAQ